MEKPPKVPFFLFLLFVIGYANQGISGMPDQSMYYLMRESWGLSATMLGAIGFITGLAWYIKPLWGAFIDFLPIKGYHTKYYLYSAYIGLALCYMYTVIFGLTFITVIITGLLVNICIGFADVANDTHMVKAERKYKLKGRSQAIQWISLGVAGLIVALGGAYIADSFHVDIAYRVAEGFCLCFPLMAIVYLFFSTNTKKWKGIDHKSSIGSSISGTKVKFKDFIQVCKKQAPVLWLPLLFIICLQLSPSFGTALMIKMREGLGISKMFMGYLGASGTVLGIVGYMLYYWKCYKIPLKGLLYFAVAATVITNLAYLYIPNQWVILTYSIAFGAVSGIVHLTILSFFASLVPKGFEGFFYAIITSLSNLCARGGLLLGGYIYDVSNYEMTVIVSSALTAITLIFIPFLNKKL